jgi:hypothetical protein
MFILRPALSQTFSTAATCSWIWRKSGEKSRISWSWPFYLNHSLTVNSTFFLHNKECIYSNHFGETEGKGWERRVGVGGRGGVGTKQFILSNTVHTVLYIHNGSDWKWRNQHRIDTCSLDKPNTVTTTLKCFLWFAEVGMARPWRP